RSPCTRATSRPKRACSSRPAFCATANQGTSSRVLRLRRMRGAIAAGHPLTAEVGAAILDEGGNAVDACVAAGFASWVVERPLTGPGGGGFMLVHRARDGTTRLLDFFDAVPGLGRSRRPVEMDSVDVDFDRETAQV